MTKMKLEKIEVRPVTKLHAVMVKVKIKTLHAMMVMLKVHKVK